MAPLTLLLGSLVGFSLGLTGGGGAIVAVPLLVYGVGLSPRDAVGVSLMTVGATALAGFLQRARRGQVEFPTGLLFAAAGMVGAPPGAALADRLPEALLLTLFAGLMLLIALRMWTAPPALDSTDEADGPSCQRDSQGRLRLTSRCARTLTLTGLAVGLLSGLFGVGGGFLIVPALATLTGMKMHRAIGTSLLVIALISAAGTASHLLAGNDLSMSVAWLFAAGGLAGLMAGSGLAKRLAGPALRRAFAAAIVAVAVFMLARTLA